MTRGNGCEMPSKEIDALDKNRFLVHIHIIFEKIPEQEKVIYDHLQEQYKDKKLTFIESPTPPNIVGDKSQSDMWKEFELINNAPELGISTLTKSFKSVW